MTECVFLFTVLVGGSAARLGIQHGGITAIGSTPEPKQTPNAHGRNPASGKEEVVAFIRDGDWEFIFELPQPGTGWLHIRMLPRSERNSGWEALIVLQHHGRWSFFPPKEMKSVESELLEVVLRKLPIMWDSMQQQLGNLDVFCVARDRFIEVNTVKRLRRKMEDKLRKNPELVKALALIMGIS